MSRWSQKVRRSEYQGREKESVFRMSEIVMNKKERSKKLILLRVKKGILDSFSIYYLKRKEILTGFLTCLLNARKRNLFIFNRL